MDVLVGTDEKILTTFGLSEIHSTVFASENSLTAQSKVQLYIIII